MDDALLQSCAAGEPGFPCVRFYAWEPPALSLGIHQDVLRAADPAALEALGVDLVRRLTGGRAVLHDAELTYSIVASSRRGLLAGSVMQAYRRVSESLASGLRELGLPASLSPGDPRAGLSGREPCFSRLSPLEVQVAGFKVIGSVQLQRGGCLLQHGSIPLRLDRERLRRATRSGGDVAALGLEDLLRRSIDRAALGDALAGGFETRFGVPLLRGTLSSREEAGARLLAESRYGSSAWNLRRPARRPAMVEVEGVRGGPPPTESSRWDSGQGAASVACRRRR